MNVEILSVGTELLLGNIVNTNAQYISQKLAELGINVYYQTTVGDNENRLKNVLDAAFKRADAVIITGGLGPTQDDLTKEVVCSFMKKELACDEKSMQCINDYFKNSSFKMSENNKKQALFPKDAYILKNDFGTAPGCIIESNGKIAILFPGPPKEMKPMFDNYALPYLRRFKTAEIRSKVLKIAGMPEGVVAEKLKSIIDNQTNPTIATYVKDGEVTIRISSKTSDEALSYKLINDMKEKIYKIVGEYIYGEDETTLEGAIGKLLIEKNLTISTAESCTGGKLAARLINYPGISEVFMEGDVTYSNDAKMRRLHVKSETLDLYGAVSYQTALEMAKGIAKEAHTDIGLSTTGLAGPGGGTEEMPVGLVYVGMYYKGKSSYKKLNLNGDREKIRDRAVLEVLSWLRLTIANDK